MNNSDHLDWTLVQVFLAVMTMGSLSGGARSLGLSQPTVGRQIAQLEAQLGTVLFTRSARGLVPTDLARALLPRAETMQAAAASLSMTATGTTRDIDGTVRVTASEVFSAYVMPGLIAPLLEQHLGLEIELVASNSNENLLMREADVAVRMARPTQNDLIMQKLGDTPLGIYAHESYLAKRGAPKTFEDLKDHVILGYDKSDQIIRGMAEVGFKARPADFRFRCDNQIVLFEALKTGAGIGFAQIMLASQVPGLVQILPDMPLPSLPIYTVAHRELNGSARVRAVYDHFGRAIKAALATPD